MRGFTPALIPASAVHCEAHEVQILQHLLCAAQTIPAQEHPCPLGAAAGAAGQGSQTSCSYQSQTEHSFFTDAVNFRQFLSNGTHQTDQSGSGENGHLSGQINLPPPTALFKPTHTQIQEILQ